MNGPSLPRRCRLLVLTCMAVSGLALSAGRGHAAAAPPAKGAATNAPAAKVAAVPATNQPPAVVVIPKSSFTDKVSAGKDPFFPASTRRNPPPPPPPSLTTNVVTPPTVSAQTNVPHTVVVQPPPPPPPKKALASSFLALKGVSVGRSRVASVSTTVKFYDLRPGEEMMMRVPEYGAVKVKCVEIKDRSVILQVEGEEEPAELKLRPGL